MIHFLLFLMACANIASGEQNTTEPPLVPYVETGDSSEMNTTELPLVPYIEEDSLKSDSNNVDAYSGDAIIIELDPNIPDDKEKDRILQEYGTDNGSDNSTDIHIDRPTPVGEGEDRIINGYFARNGWFPMKARIWPRFQRGSSSCGATIIGRYWVLTAAHCLRSRTRGALRGVSMRVGSVHVGSGGQLLSAISAFVHPNYRDDVTRGYDVGLLKTRQRIVYNRYAQGTYLAGLPNIRPGSNLYAAGWGRTQTGGQSDWLKYAIVRVGTCPSSAFPRNSVVCVDRSRDRVCHGDSGGFLGSFRNGHWVVDGIVSFGPGGCEAFTTGYFTSVAYFQRWILNTANNN